MAEILEEPERARGADAGLLVVDDDRDVVASTPCIASTCSIIHMNAFEGSGIRVRQAHTPQIEMERTRDVTRGVGIRWPEVEDQERLSAFDFARELRRA